MTKYDTGFKYQVVQAYLSGEGGRNFIAKKYGVKASTNVRKWVRQYEVLGYSGLERRKNKQEYSMNFKLDVLHYYYQSGLDMERVAIKFNLPSTQCLSIWKKQFNTHGIDGLKPKQKGRPSMSKQSESQKSIQKKKSREQELERELELLRAELAFIKKLRALGIDIPDRLKNESLESSTRSEKNSN
ncbi:ISBmu5a transposase [Listeria monocytogenes]|uniref:transposase n=1 Tax=Listeria monocytogenes TaxID=1639 RepID=UPI000A1D49EC|nr:transposase [Listeria monocytogenes]ARM71768.1 ISBmu5a transposase [Listeria monocytogenes]ARM71980.1 ISBmu5a transposase [Listeria monocytogenes]